MYKHFIYSKHLQEQKHQHRSLYSFQVFFYSVGFFFFCSAKAAKIYHTVYYNMLSTLPTLGMESNIDTLI